MRECVKCSDELRLWRSLFGIGSRSLRFSASAELSRRVEKVVGSPPLVEMDDRQRRAFHEALPGDDNFEDLLGKWQRRSWRRKRHVRNSALSARMTVLRGL